MNNGAKVISDAIAGNDFITVVVDGKAYTIYPPTIERLSGAISHLSEVQEAETARDVLLSLGDTGKYAHALSWMINGDESLSSELEKARFDEVVYALEASLSLVGTDVFLKAVSLAKSVSLLAARPK